MSSLSAAAPEAFDSFYRTLFEEHPQPMWVVENERQRVLAVNAIALRRFGTEPPAQLDASTTRVVFGGVDACLIVARPESRAAREDEWVWIVDTTGKLTWSSHAIERILGYRPEELVGRPFYDVYFPESHEKVKQFFGRLVAAGAGWSDLAQRLRHRDGHEVFVETTAAPIIDREGKLSGFRGTDRVTNNGKLEERIRYESRRDPVTGLPNRIYFQERLASALTSGSTIAVLFIDLDHFKVLNDTFGHDIGDNALQVIASMLRSMAGSEEAVARVGGDELTVFVHVERLEDARRMARRILDAIAMPLSLAGERIHVAASVGIAMSPLDGQTSTELVRNAEHAMRRAKELGRNAIQNFTPEMRADHGKRVALESDLRRALELGEFLLHYQPLYDASTWQVVGVEALIRWQHHLRGLLGPDEFIELAEKSGMIVPIGAWVLREACTQMQQWRTTTGRDIRIAVNLSARQLQEPELIESVRDILRETGLDPRALELEITESVAMQNAEATLGTLQALKAMGLSVAVDDFGTGYSSLLYLTRFPIDTVKVDRQFIRNVTTDPNDAAVVGAVVALARSLRLKTVAEGVETVAQRDFLSEHRCTEMQGFLFSRPLPAEELLKAVSGKAVSGKAVTSGK